MTNYDFKEAKKKWRLICQEREDVPIYKQAWYWDATTDSDDDWKVILYEGNNVIVAFPFLYKKVHGLWRIELPWQVQRSGFYIGIPKETAEDKKILYLIEALDYICDRIPKYDYFNVNFDIDNWSPFYWKGFTATPQYTYTISGKDPEIIKATFSRNRRRRISNGEKKHEIRINNLDIQEVWDFFELSYEKRDRKLSYSKEKFMKLMEATSAHDALEIMSIYDRQKIIAVEITLKDKQRYYWQLGTHLPEYQDATSLAAYHTIQEALREEKKFDFEGSMIKGVAEFNLSFLPDTEIYYTIHDESLKYTLLKDMRKAWYKFMGK